MARNPVGRVWRRAAPGLCLCVGGVGPSPQAAARADARRVGPQLKGRGTKIIARKNVRKWVSAARFRAEDKVLPSGKGGVTLYGNRKRSRGGQLKCNLTVLCRPGVFSSPGRETTVTAACFLRTPLQTPFSLAVNGTH